ncbi:hypothetical protein FKM82_029178, partial [Ascaphus truei]
APPPPSLSSPPLSLPPAVLALLCLSGYLIWRNWKRKNTKSMNFDNPVYRKTTEEEEDEEEEEGGEIHIGQTPQVGHVYPSEESRLLYMSHTVNSLGASRVTRV